MGWRSEQLNELVNVVRGNTSVLSMQELVKMLSGVSFEEARRLMVGNQEYGNTKFPDAWLVLCYFKGCFIAKQASILAGYANYTRDDGIVVGGYAIKKRMARVNTKSMFALARGFMTAGHITKEDLRQILVPKGQSQLAAARGSLYKFWAKELVVSAVKKQGSRAKAAKAFGTTEEVVDKWADMNASRPTWL